MIFFILKNVKIAVLLKKIENVKEMVLHYHYKGVLLEATIIS